MVKRAFSMLLTVLLVLPLFALPVQAADKNWEWVIEPTFVNAGTFSEGLAAVSNGKEYGYIDKTGKLVIDYQYIAAKDFSEGLALVELPNNNEREKGTNLTIRHFQYIDKSGNVVLEFTGTENYGSFSGGIAPRTTPANIYASNEPEKMEYIDRDGNVVSVPHQDPTNLNPLKFNEGLAIVKQGTLYGYMDTNFKMVIDFKFYGAGAFNNGKAVVITSKGDVDEVAVIDKTGKIISAFPDQSEVTYRSGLSDGMMVASLMSGKNALMDINGNIICEIPDEYGLSIRFSEGLATVIPENDKSGAIDKAGNLVIGYDFTGLGPFSEGLAAAYTGVWTDARGGYIRYTGELANPTPANATTTQPAAPVQEAAPEPIATPAPAPQNPIRAFLDGQEIMFTQPPVIESGTTLVPVRAIFEALNMEVNYDGATQTVDAKGNGYEIIMKINDTNATVNGQTHTLSVPAKIVNSRTLVPIRFISESVGLEVVWDGASRKIMLTTKVAEVPPVEIPVVPSSGAYYKEYPKVPEFGYHTGLGEPFRVADMDDYIHYLYHYDETTLTPEIFGKYVDALKEINVTVTGGWEFDPTEQGNFSIYYEGDISKYVEFIVNAATGVITIQLPQSMLDLD